jgi:hypothetical protein
MIRRQVPFASKSTPQGLKPQLVLMALSARMKVVPCYRAYLKGGRKL